MLRYLVSVGAGQSLRTSINYFVRDTFTISPAGINQTSRENT